MSRIRSVVAGRSLRDRVTLASAGTLAAGLAILTLAIAVFLTHQASTDASSRLSERADAVRSTLIERDGRLVVRDAPDDAVLDAQAWVYDAHGRAVARPPARAEVQRAADALVHVTHDTQHDLGDLRLRADPAYAGTTARRIGTVVVAMSLQPAEHTRDYALLAMLALDLFVLAGGAWLARRAVGNALRPVADMTARAADWSEHDLDRRFGLGPPRDELTALSATLDGLLARIAASLRHEQRFSAEMAHELRTPLAGLRGEAELALWGPDVTPATRASLEQIVASSARMQTVIDTLLTVARGEAPGQAAASVVQDAVREAIEEIRPAAVTAGIALGMAVADGDVLLRVGVERALAARALAPLLDNAVRHALSRVTVSIRREDEVIVRVDDDGAGLDGGAAEELFVPGRSTGGGAGLGLALARRLARSGGGEVVAVPGAPGGRFELRLPAVDGVPAAGQARSTGG